MLSGRRDLNPRPLDPQVDHDCVTIDQLVLYGSPTSQPVKRRVSNDDSGRQLVTPKMIFLVYRHRYHDSLSVGRANRRGEQVGD